MRRLLLLRRLHEVAIVDAREAQHDAEKLVSLAGLIRPYHNLPVAGLHPYAQLTEQLEQIVHPLSRIADATGSVAVRAEPIHDPLVMPHVYDQKRYDLVGDLLRDDAIKLEPGRPDDAGRSAISSGRTVGRTTRWR